MFSIILAVLTLGTVAYIGHRMWALYQSEPGTVKEKLLAAGHDSAVIFIHKILLLGGFIDSGIVNTANALNMPEVTSFVQTYMPPQWVGWVAASIALVTIVARLRSMVKPE